MDGQHGDRSVVVGVDGSEPALRAVRWAAREAARREARPVVRASDRDGIVVGSRRHGDFSGLVLGSVSNALVHKAAYPVAVVQPDTEVPA